MIRRPPRSTLFPTRRSSDLEIQRPVLVQRVVETDLQRAAETVLLDRGVQRGLHGRVEAHARKAGVVHTGADVRSEEHTSELQSQSNLVCRLLLEKKKKHTRQSALRTTSDSDAPRYARARQGRRASTRRRDATRAPPASIAPTPAPGPNAAHQYHP